MAAAKPKKQKSKEHGNSQRFEPAKIESLFVVLDAIAWLDGPASGEIAQFAGIDPRTAGKLLKNARQISLVDLTGDSYTLVLPYPYKGSLDQKKAVVREALVRMPLLTSVRQFMGLGDALAVALRKAATVVGLTPYVESDLLPLVEWARSLQALEPRMLAEDLVEDAEAAKAERHRTDAKRRVAFLSHSSKDKAFIRQLAADLTSSGVGVWLDEQRIRVGDSIPERIAQGLAESDYFLLAVSAASVESECRFVRPVLMRDPQVEIEEQEREDESQYKDNEQQSETKQHREPKQQREPKTAAKETPPKETPGKR